MSCTFRISQKHLYSLKPTRFLFLLLVKTLGKSYSSLFLSLSDGEHSQVVKSPARKLLALLLLNILCFNLYYTLEFCISSREEVRHTQVFYDVLTSVLHTSPLLSINSDSARVLGLEGCTRLKDMGLILMPTWQGRDIFEGYSEIPFSL